MSIFSAFLIPSIISRSILASCLLAVLLWCTFVYQHILLRGLSVGPIFSFITISSTLQVRKDESKRGICATILLLALVDLDLRLDFVEIDFLVVFVGGFRHRRRLRRLTNKPGTNLYFLYYIGCHKKSCLWTIFSIIETT